MSALYLGDTLTRIQRQRAILVVLAFVGMVVYVAFVSGSGADGLLRCPFRWITGFSCPGCGMTRACTHAIHGDFWTSLEFHPVGIPLVLSFAMMAVFNAVQVILGKQIKVAIIERNPRLVNAFWWGVAIFALGYGAIRLALELAGILTPV